jgi:serine/threonine protein kinase
MRGGAYRILELLGKGGMGVTYLAADTGAFDRKCVVKELLDYYDPTDPDEARKAQVRFETEARLLAELSHPGIPRIYSYFSEVGRHYIVMEYIEGEILHRAVTHADPSGRNVPARPLPAEQVVRHAIRICRVLEYLADRPVPVVHHDVKPANLIVDRNSGEVRLVDFGTAQTRTHWAVQARLEQGASSLFGTEGYAAPEQYQGLSEPRSDVYALAATVYHLVTDDDPGDHPFQFPRLGTLPGPLADGLSRALHPEVRRRSSASAFRQALEAWLIPDDGVHPFVFRGGAVARTVEELVALCDQHWTEARQHLADGDLERWFRERNRHDLVAKAQSARLEPNADAALEAFLRRLDPRLPPPRLVVEPHDLHFGRLSRGAHGKGASRRLTVRNEGRGYAQAAFNASVPWLRLEPSQVGCLNGVEVPVTASVDASLLPLRQEHQAVITCIPARGARIFLSATVELNLVGEAVARISTRLRTLLPFLARGARLGFSSWIRTLRSLLKSRIGVSVVVAEVVLLAGVLAFLWSSGQGGTADPIALAWAFVRALPLALLVTCVFSILAFMGGAAAQDLIRSRAQNRAQNAEIESSSSRTAG